MALLARPLVRPWRLVRRWLPPLDFITIHYAYFVVTCLISAVIFAYLLFFADPAEGRVAQGMLMGSATVVISLLLQLLVFFNHPHGDGVGRLQPVGMERTLRVIDIQAEAVGLVVIGPEAPLVDGLADTLRAAAIPVFGPSKAAAQLEGSKGFTKDLCARAGIPTAGYVRVASRADADVALTRTFSLPVVIKADGLAAGKGVVIAFTRAEADAALDALFADGEAEAVIEEFLEGEEASLFVLTDGTTLLVPPDETGAFMQVVEAIRTAPDPAPLPDGAWRHVPGENRRVVPGVDGLVAAAADTLSLYSELGASWALPAHHLPKEVSTR